MSGWLQRAYHKQGESPFPWGCLLAQTPQVGPTKPFNHQNTKSNENRRCREPSELFCWKRKAQPFQKPQ